MNVSPLDETGKPVDWWFMYKVPQLGKGLNTDQTTGYEYVYYDSAIDATPSKQAQKVDVSVNRIDHGTGALNLTLDSVFNQPDATTGWILYNDETPQSAGLRDDGNLGHTKGVIAFDTATNTAYWLLHSWPKFAEPNATTDPTPKYGQTYLCMSMTLASARTLAAMMATHHEPQTYLNRLPASLPKNDPLAVLTRPLPAAQAPQAGSINLQTQAKMPFTVIAKNREWNQDFWNGLVGPELKEDIDVDTWIRGPIPPTADTDGIHKTFDIKYINLGALGAHWAWPETHDHAKWGITTHDFWICVGDINRMISQRKRGGGTIAFQNQTLWTALSKTDLLLAPPGLTRNEARAIVHATHVEPVFARAKPRAGPPPPPPPGGAPPPGGSDPPAGVTSPSDSASTNGGTIASPAAAATTTGTAPAAPRGAKKKAGKTKTAGRKKTAGKRKLARKTTRKKTAKKTRAKKANAKKRSAAQGRRKKR
jgi:deoxyribonuclease II